MNMTTVPSNQLKAMQQEIADLKETIAQQAEAIRLKDAAIKLLYSWANNCDSEFMNDHDWKNSDYPTIQKALSIQPSPEILQARDERIVAACAQYVYAMGGTKGSVLLAEMMLSGEWRKYL